MWMNILNCVAVQQMHMLGIKSCPSACHFFPFMDEVLYEPSFVIEGLVEVFERLNFVG